MVLTKLSIILVLFLLHGFFAMIELSLISLRRSKLESEALEGDKRSQKLLTLMDAPHVPLAALQALMTFLGVFASIYTAFSFSEPIHDLLVRFNLAYIDNNVSAYVVIVFLVSYLLLILGELLPTRIALNYPERICKTFLPLISIFATIFYPIVRVLDISNDLIFSFVPSQKEEVTESEIRDLISKGSKVGVIEKGEEKIVSKVFRLGDRPASSIMTPRQEVVWLDINDPIEKIWEEVAQSDYTYFPIADGDVENIIGIISTKDLSSCLIKKQDCDLRTLIKEPLRVPANLSALQVLDAFKQERKHIALLIDEFGGIDGMITTHDLMEAMVGDLSDTDQEEPLYIKNSEGNYLVDASIDLDDLFTLLDIPNYTHEDHVGYHSLGGFMLKSLGHLPQQGEKFTFSGYVFEVISMDKHRVSKISVQKLAENQSAEAA